MENQLNLKTQDILKYNTRQLIKQFEELLTILNEFHQINSYLISDATRNTINIKIIKGIEDLLFGSTFMNYELLSYLYMCLQSKNNYEKRYHMQCINECMCESYSFFYGNNNGIMVTIQSIASILNNPIINNLSNKLTESIEILGDKYRNITLRNITAHYDKPYTMYENIAALNNEDESCKGVSHYLQIQNQIFIFAQQVSDILLHNMPQTKGIINYNEKDKKEFSIKKWFETKLAQHFSFNCNLNTISNESLQKATKFIDTIYFEHKKIEELKKYLPSANNEWELMDTICMMMMMVTFMRCDIICAIRSYLNSETNFEQAMHLRKIHIIETSALKHIYGYTAKSREQSIWTKLIQINNDNNKEKIQLIEERLNAFESHLDSIKRNLFIHFIEKGKPIVAIRYKAYFELNHFKEINEALNLLSLCKEIESYTTYCLRLITESANRKMKENQTSYRKWIEKLHKTIGNEQAIKILDNFEKTICKVFDFNILEQRT